MDTSDWAHDRTTCQRPDTTSSEHDAGVSGGLQEEKEDEENMGQGER